MYNRLHEALCTKSLTEILHHPKNSAFIPFHWIERWIVSLDCNECEDTAAAAGDSGFKPSALQNEMDIASDSNKLFISNTRVQYHGNKAMKNAWNSIGIEWDFIALRWGLDINFMRACVRKICFARQIEIQRIGFSSFLLLQMQHN